MVDARGTGGHLAVGTGIGQPVRRKEDVRLLTGNGRYSDDLVLPGQLFGFVLRSPHAHAVVRTIDSVAAKAAPGVAAVLTRDDIVADRLKPIPPDFFFLGPIEVQKQLPDVLLVNSDGSDIFPSPFHLLAMDRVRFVGEGVAFVVARTLAQAKDAAELIEVDYEPLPAVTATRDAAAPGAPLLWPDNPSNVCVDGEVGDKAAADAAFAGAAHVVTLDAWIQRVTGVPMEARSCVGVYDPDTDRYTLHAGSGGVVRQKGEISGILGVPVEKVRVVARDIGGNFGTKNSIFPEFALCVWASRRTGRPVKWTCERTEAFLTDYQGRDLAAHCELALDKEGNFLGLRGDNLSNLGGYAASTIPLRKGLGIMSGLYRIPAAHFRGRAVMSNTAPTAPYRSAGRPEAMFIIERIIDKAAQTCGFDRIELRRRNLIDPDELPYRNPLGVVYDNGEYARVMDRATELGDWNGYGKRRAASMAAGRYRGIGLANYIELTLGNPRERAEVIANPDGSVDVVIGTLASGQGHETSFAQCVSEWLGVPFESVRLVQGDTDIVPVGGGSHSGRSMRMAGFVMGKAADGVIIKGKRIAALMFDTRPEEIEFKSGIFAHRGTNRSASLKEVAVAARERSDLPDDLKGRLAAEHDHLFKEGGFPYGCHVCEVEVDPETGRVTLERYAAVDDVGRAINPLILHGQAHGGIAQGVGQALWEHSHYDAESGQLLAASFMDYAMPHADTLPSFVTGISEVPSPTNPLGVRAGGEGGTTPALAVVINAVVDALAPLGITHIDMPATPEKVWRAIRNAK
ncbi:MAG: xanthine dehydrogenase family protein molybdopterin-binding subunit [Hyphomicrobiaceae bacterium]